MYNAALYVIPSRTAVLFSTFDAHFSMVFLEWPPFKAVLKDHYSLSAPRLLTSGQRMLRARGYQ